MQTVHKVERKLRGLLRKFHGLMKMRMILNDELSKTKQEILFTESLQPGKARADIMRKVGHETVNSRIEGGVLWRQ